ncbi:MAG: hypothetical protein CMJ78_24690 [Planctomycetaceae bacterium]|nr:hypothetical protein [Planctomycetaceae bacterium]
MKRYQTVDEYIANAEYWQPELIRLREILQSTKLVETVKWGGPCYTHNDKMVVGLGAFKSYIGLWFYQGALRSDKDGVLINAQEGKTKALRQWRFESLKEIKVRAIKAYVKEAIELVEQGKEIKPDRSKPVEIPPELQEAFKQNKKARSAFDQFTKGKQREFTAYIADAKRAETKAKRLEKILPLIEAGIGLHDKYH